MRIRSDKIRSLKDIEIEKQRLQNLLLRSEYQLKDVVRETKAMFTWTSLKYQAKRAILNYIGNIISGIIR